MNIGLFLSVLAVTVYAAPSGETTVETTTKLQDGATIETDTTVVDGSSSGDDVTDVVTSDNPKTIETTTKPPGDNGDIGKKVGSFAMENIIIIVAVGVLVLLFAFCWWYCCCYSRRASAKSWLAGQSSSAHARSEKRAGKQTSRRTAREERQRAVKQKYNLQMDLIEPGDEEA